MDSEWANLLPPPCCYGQPASQAVGRRLQLICAGPAGARKRLGWSSLLPWLPHSGAKATHQRTWQHAIPSDELQPTNMTLERNSRFSPDNKKKKIHISVSSQHLAEYHMKHVCFKHISKELLDVHSLRDEKGHGVACVVLGRCDERIWGMRGKKWGPRRGLLGTGV